MPASWVVVSGSGYIRIISKYVSDTKRLARRNPSPKPRRGGARTYPNSPSSSVPSTARTWLSRAASCCARCSASARFDANATSRARAWVASEPRAITSCSTRNVTDRSRKSNPSEVFFTSARPAWPGYTTATQLPDSAAHSASAHSSNCCCKCLANRPCSFTSGIRQLLHVCFLFVRAQPPRLAVEADPPQLPGSQQRPVQPHPGHLQPLGHQVVLVALLEQLDGVLGERDLAPHPLPEHRRRVRVVDGVPRRRRHPPPLAGLAARLLRVRQLGGRHRMRV